MDDTEEYWAGAVRSYWDATMAKQPAADQWDALWGLSHRTDDKDYVLQTEAVTWEIMEALVARVAKTGWGEQKPTLGITEVYLEHPERLLQVAAVVGALTSDPEEKWGTWWGLLAATRREEAGLSWTAESVDLG